MRRHLHNVAWVRDGLGQGASEPPRENLGPNAHVLLGDPGRDHLLDGGIEAVPERAVRGLTPESRLDAFPERADALRLRRLGGAVEGVFVQPLPALARDLL